MYLNKPVLAILCLACGSVPLFLAQPIKPRDTISHSQILWTDVINVPSLVRTSSKGVPNGVASLDATGKVPISQLPVMPPPPGGSGGIQSGPALPATCSEGMVFFWTSQPQGQQLYNCTTSGWQQYTNVGNSGALAFTNGSLDIVPSVVPTRNGSNTFSGQFIIMPSGPEPSCSASNRGQHFFVNGTAGADHYDICSYTGTGYAWKRLF